MDGRKKGQGWSKRKAVDQDKLRIDKSRILV
jgi:hypothetical protein